MKHRHSSLALGSALLVFALFQPAGPALSQGQGDASAPPPPPVSSTIATNMGGCDAAGLSLSRPWIGPGEQLDWWAWGFAYGSSVGVQLIDPTGKSTSMGSV